MLFVDLRRALQRFLAAGPHYEPILNLIESCAKAVTELLPDVARIGDDANGGQLHQKLNGLMVAIRVVPVSKASASLQRLIEALQGLPPGAPESPWEPLIQGLIKFRDAYDAFHDHRKGSQAAAVGLIASEVHRQYRQTLRLLNYFLQVSEAPRTNAPDEDELEVVFYQVENLASLLDRLQQIAQLYLIACKLIGVDHEEKPLKLLSSEVGSFWAKLGGDKAALLILGSLLAAASTFIEAQTFDGRLRTIKQQIEVVMLAAEMREKLKPLGIDTSNIEDGLRAQADDISASLKVLTRGQEKLRVNDEIIGPAKRPLSVEWDSTTMLTDIGNSTPNRRE